MKEKNKLSEKFSFSPAQYDDILKKIKNFGSAKTAKQTVIPTKIVKQNSKCFTGYFYNNIYVCIENSDFPTELKSINVIPVNKKVKKFKG